jgi:hypothetical protein
MILTAQEVAERLNRLGYREARNWEARYDVEKQRHFVYGGTFEHGGRSTWRWRLSLDFAREVLGLPPLPEEA